MILQGPECDYVCFKGLSLTIHSTAQLNQRLGFYYLTVFRKYSAVQTHMPPIHPLCLHCTKKACYPGHFRPPKSTETLPGSPGKPSSFILSKFLKRLMGLINGSSTWLHESE